MQNLGGRYQVQRYCLHMPTSHHGTCRSLNQSAATTAATATELQEDNAKSMATRKDANNDDNNKKQIIIKNYNQLVARGDGDIDTKLQRHEACTSTATGTAYGIAAVATQVGSGNAG